MACTNPIQLRTGTVENPTVPCGECLGCKKDKTRSWALRCVHEASLHEENCFVTLTYDADHLPLWGSLQPEDVTLWLKRLRRRIEPRRVRYLVSGEYGTLLRRPHYHAILFGYDFPDKRQVAERDGFPVWTSQLLSTLWTAGLHELGSVSYASAAYTAAYVTKNTGPQPLTCDAETGEVHSLHPEYTRMSRNPGLGAGWADKYPEELLRHDAVISDGRELPLPNYYLKRLEVNHPMMAEWLRIRRKLIDRSPRMTERHLQAQAAINQAEVDLYHRELE